MTDDTIFDFGRLAAYVGGECPHAEAAEIERWVAECPGREKLVADLRRAREALVRAGRAETTPAALEPIYTAVLATITTAPADARPAAARAQVARTSAFRRWLLGDKGREGGAHPTTFGGLAGRVVAALLEQGETELTAAEIERLRRLIQQSKEKNR